MSREALLVGSIPFADTETVFSETASRLADCVRRLPDGETGERLAWVGYQLDRLRQVDGLELVGIRKMQGPAFAMELPHFRVAPGRSPESIDLGELGYAAIAENSFETFQRFRADGRIGSHVRFQVSLPTPAAIASGIHDGLPDLLPIFESAMAEEIKRLVSSIPPSDLTIQWDVAHEIIGEEFARHPENAPPSFGAPPYGFDTVLDSVVRISSEIPDEAELGIHLCYGSPDDKHIVEPVDASVITDAANFLAERIRHPIAYIHAPVPIERDDDAFFLPLSELKLKPGTRLILGLIHHEDGVEGARRRMEAAEKYVRGFGVAAECGLGRMLPSLIPGLLDLHREVAQLEG